MSIDLHIFAWMPASAHFYMATQTHSASSAWRSFLLHGSVCCMVSFANTQWNIATTESKALQGPYLAARMLAQGTCRNPPGITEPEGQGLNMCTTKRSADMQC